MTPNKLRFELSIAFLLLVGIFAGLGWVVLSRMAEIDRQLSELLESRWVKVRLATEAVRYSSRNNRITMQIFLLNQSDAIEPLLAERARNSDTITELLEQIGTKIDSPEEKKLLARIWATRKPYVESYKEALALLLNQGDYEKARSTMVRVTLPRLIEYHDEWEQFVRLQGDGIRKAGLAGDTTFEIARNRLICLLGTGLFVTIGLWIGALVYLPKRF